MTLAATITPLQADSAVRRLAGCSDEQRDRRSHCERELVRMYQQSPQVRDRIIEAFRPLALGLARRLKRGEEPLDDLRQVAMVGLLKALDRFDPDRGQSFAAYAAPTILGELRRHYRDTGWAVHVPRSGQELAQRLVKTERELVAEGHAVTADVLAERLGVSVEDVVDGRIAVNAMRADSTDRPRASGEPEGQSLADRQGSIDAGYELVEDRMALSSVAKILSERDRLILQLRYRNELSQKAIGERIGVSQMQVSRLLRRIEADLASAAATPRRAELV